MATNASRPQKDTDCIVTDTELAALKSRAREAIAGSWLLGIDAAEAIHFWSPTTRQVAVFEDPADTDPTIVDTRRLPIEDTPVAWAAQTVAERDGRLWLDLRLSVAAQRELEADR